MRKVKAVTALVATLASVCLSGLTLRAEAPASIVGQGEMLAVQTVPVTSAASIETTAIVTTVSSAASAMETTTVDSTENVTTAAETTVSAELQTETTAAAPTVQTVAAPVTMPLIASLTTQTEAPMETETTAPLPSSSGISVTEREYIMLCNVVGHEYGADWIEVPEKALVVEVIMNRVQFPLFPDTIYEVLTQPGQFTGLSQYISLETFAPQVTDSVRAAVDLYLAHPEQFRHGYLYFTGNGYYNTFR